MSSAHGKLACERDWIRPAPSGISQHAAMTEHARLDRVLANDTVENMDRERMC